MRRVDVHEQSDRLSTSSLRPLAMPAGQRRRLQSSPRPRRARMSARARARVDRAQRLVPSRAARNHDDRRLHRGQPPQKRAGQERHIAGHAPACARTASARWRCRCRRAAPRPAISSGTTRRPRDVPRADRRARRRRSSRATSRSASSWRSTIAVRPSDERALVHAAEARGAPAGQDRRRQRCRAVAHVQTDKSIKPRDGTRPRVARRRRRVGRRGDE